jgi:hypothetical protein
MGIDESLIKEGGIRSLLAKSVLWCQPGLSLEFHHISSGKINPALCLSSESDVKNQLISGMQKQAAWIRLSRHLRDDDRALWRAATSGADSELMFTQPPRASLTTNILS